MRILKISFGFMFFVSLFACGTPKNTSSNDEKSTLSIGYFAGACRGYCPHFQINIYADQSVEFEGKRNVLLEGDTSFQMEEKDFLIIQEIINAANLAEADSTYEQPIMDIPVRIFYFLDNGIEKSIRFNTRIPKQLETLEKAIISYCQGKNLIAKTPDELKNNVPQNEMEYIVQLAKGIEANKLIADLSPAKVTIVKKLSPNLDYYLIKYQEKRQVPAEVMEKIRALEYVIEVQENREVEKRGNG